MPKKWNVPSPHPQKQVELSNALNIQPLLAQLLINRGILEIEEAQSFLTTHLSHLHDPFLLKDMDRAVARLKKARENDELVLIFGDYDVDGVTSSVILNKTLKKFGLRVLNHIPHRVEDGYGLNHAIAEFAQAEGVKLLLAVDCGIGAIEEVANLNRIGIDVIILDHHEPPKGPLPQACAIVNPKRADCVYPFKHLASAGLAGKLTQALFKDDFEEHMDLVAIGTIADVAELRGENRIFVKHGLPRVNQTKNKGLLALLDIAKIRDKKITPHFVGFILGPRINATGRMDSAHKSLDLLLTDDAVEAARLAKLLDELNAQRQKMQKDVLDEALAMIEQEVNFQDHKIIVIGKEGWHKGILGIVASRITEMYYRPSIVISFGEAVGTGSARSIEGFHLFEALTHCAASLEHYGGHKGAAGLTIRKDRIDEFRRSINDFARQTIELVDLTPNLSIDCEIPLSQLNVDLVERIEALEPFGEGNPQPVFCSRQVIVKSAPAILGKETIKFWVSDGKVTLPVLGFGMAKYRDYVVPGKAVDLAYQVTLDDWNKAPTVTLKLKDIREAN